MAVILISEAPPPPPPCACAQPVLIPAAPPPLNPPFIVVVPPPPTFMKSVCPGVTARLPSAYPPRPPTTERAFELPCAPHAFTLTDVIPAGTTHVCTAPVKLKLVTTGVAGPPGL